MENMNPASQATPLPVPFLMDPTPTDQELVSQYKAGDEDAFNCLVLKYGDRVYRHCYRIVRDHEESENLCQEVFLKVFRSFGKYDEQNSFGTWLYRVTANTCIDYLRKQQRTIDTTSADGEPDHFAGARVDPSKIRTPEDSACSSEVLRILNHAVNELPDKLRTAFILKEYEGCTLDEIATLLNTCQGTVKNRLHRARKSLRNKLDGSTLV